MKNHIEKYNSEIKMTVEIIVVKEDDFFVAYCPALELSGYGDTIEKAKKSFETEIKVFFEETHQRGTLERYLLKNGWSL
jgi:predicted RNase H-like HicB family nuclease